MHITVCICTYQRAALLKRLLAELSRQETNGLFTYSVVVADNDREESGRGIVAEMAKNFPVEILYRVEPKKNIALVRNKAVAEAKGDAIAFIDDDEFPVKNWLLNLFQACARYNAAGVLGPVEPHFDEAPPQWIIKGKFCHRPRHETGFEMAWKECRTGNVLFLRRILETGEEPFREEFGAGGEDVDFFRRMTAKGHKFIWCDEAIAYEVVPPGRWKRSFMLKRGLLRGATALKSPTGRLEKLIKSAIAVPLYLLALPFLLLAGHHYFMRYAIKLCDHAGRLLALLGLNPVTEREM